MDEYRVLLVDNDQNIVHLLKYMLEEHGMRVDATTSMIDAYRMCTLDEYDVVLTAHDGVAQHFEQQRLPIPCIRIASLDEDSILASIHRVQRIILV